MPNTWQSFLDSLFAQNQFSIKLDLAVITEALELLELSSTPRHVVVVGGTNGKGSVSSLLAEACVAAGLKTGLFTSPHLISFEERFRVGSAPVSRQRLLDVGLPIMRRFSGLEQPVETSRPLTYFELATLMAWQLFSQEGADVAIFEVGMGGRLDATNALPSTLRGLTGVSIDHQAYLGDDLAAIAREKVGICRPSGPNYAVRGCSGAAELSEAARERGVSLDWLDPDAQDADSRNRCLSRALFDRVAEALSLTPAQSVTAWAAAVQSWRWPGRAMRLDWRGEEWWLDGAHNAESAARAAAWLATSGVSGVTALFGLSIGRDARSVAAPLLAHVDRWVVVAAESGPARTAAEVAAELRALGAENVQEASSVAAAITMARVEPTPRLAIGSLYLIGDVLAGLGLSSADLFGG